jgi:hypothetical protein
MAWKDNQDRASTTPATAARDAEGDAAAGLTGLATVCRSWATGRGPIYGELGVLSDDGARVECHACGRWFAALDRHATLAHDLLPDEYRAIFGLNQKQGLVGPAYRATLREEAGERLRPYWPEVAARLAEARGSWQGRRMRLQARRNPQNLERWREAARRSGAKMRAPRGGRMGASGAA